LDVASPEFVRRRKESAGSPDDWASRSQGSKRRELGEADFLLGLGSNPFGPSSRGLGAGIEEKYT